MCRFEDTIPSFDFVLEEKAEAEYNKALLQMYYECCADTIRDDIYFAIKDSENDDASDESLPDESYLETPWTW
jgi:hypothetical protein